MRTIYVDSCIVEGESVNMISKVEPFLHFGRWVYHVFLDSASIRFPRVSFAFSSANRCEAFRFKTKPFTLFYFNMLKFLTQKSKSLVPSFADNQQPQEKVVRRPAKNARSHK